MTLTPDEHRALAFIAALLLLSAAVRIGTLPGPMPVPDAAGFDLDAHVAATRAAVDEAERRGRPLGDGERVDPNRAPAAELDRLPGVGPALADRIVAAREREPFRTAADLARVPGIGERTAARLGPYLRLSSPGPGAAGVRRPAYPVAAGPGAGEEAGAGADLGDMGPLDLNRASPAELEALPGVGPVLARRIVAWRDSAGPFLAVDSLGAVRGIGPATLERLRARVRVRQP